MALDNFIVSDFVKATTEKKKKNETTVFGTVNSYTDSDGRKYVKIDGAEELTPVMTTAELKEGDRVAILVKDHSAIIMGNITSQSASTDTVEKVKETADTANTNATDAKQTADTANTNATDAKQTADNLEERANNGEFNGADGISITNVTNWYLATYDKSTVPSVSGSDLTSQWTTDPSSSVATITSTNRYLWNYEVTTYNKGDPKTKGPVIIGIYGDKGDTGRSIESVTNYYQATSEPVTPLVSSMNNWTTDPADDKCQTSPTKRYLWNYEVTIYSDSTKQVKGPIIIGTFGNTGNGIASTEIRYQGSLSGTDIPTGAWIPEIPALAPGEYLWTRTTIDYTFSVHKDISYSVSKIGDDGIGIDDVKDYYITTSEPVVPSVSSLSNWTTDPTDENAWPTQTNRYLWNYEVTTYSNGTTKTAGPTVIGTYGEKGDRGEQGIQGIQGPQGEQGIPGTNGSDGKTSYFHIKYSNVSDPTDSSQIFEVPSTYIGTYVDYTEDDSDNPSDYTWSRFEGAQGPQGEQGIPGTNGSDGKTSYLHIAYADSADGSTGFSVSDSTDKLYIGQYTDFISADSTDPTKYTWTKIKGDTGATGPQGEKGDTGADGKGISNITEYYLVTSASSGVTASTSGWTTTIQSMTSNKRYLWNYRKTEYTTGDPTNTTPCIIGVYGDKGATGGTGATGKGVSSIEDQYAISDSSTTAPASSAFSKNIPEWTSGQYIWRRQKITWLLSNGSTSVTYTTAVADMAFSTLFSQDIYMTGKFTSKVTTQVRPTANTLQMIDNIISDPDFYNPDGELTSFYDLNCDGVVDSNDADLMNKLRSGDIDFAYLEGGYNYTVPATEVNLEINAHNPNAIVSVWGTDYWGCPFSKQFGIDSLFADSDRIYLGRDLDWLLPKSSVWNDHITEANRLEREIVYLKYRFGICSDSASTKIKTVNTYEFDTNNTLTYNLYKGARVAVKFTNSNTASSPQLNVRNSGAKDIRWHGVALPESQYWGAGDIVDFVYNGEQWEIVGIVNAYGTTVTVDNELSSTSTNPVQNKIINAALNNKAASTHTHTKSQITDFPTSLKNPNALTVKANGTSLYTYNGSAAKTINIKAGSNITITSDSSGNITISSTASAGSVTGDVGTVVYEATSGGLYCDSKTANNSTNSVGIQDSSFKYKRFRFYCQGYFGLVCTDMPLDRECDAYATGNDKGKRYGGVIFPTAENGNIDSTGIGPSNHMYYELKWRVEKETAGWRVRVVDSGWLGFNAGITSNANYTGNSSAAVAGTNYISWNQRHNNGYCIYKIVAYTD